MLKVKRMKTASLVIAGLTIVSVLLAACGPDSDAVTGSVTDPVGLRPAAVDDLLGTDTIEADEAAEPATNDAASAVVEQDPEAATNVVAARGYGGNRQAQVADRSRHNFDPGATTEPRADEIAGLTYMREEEKLARDVYLALYEQWGLPVFQNVASSEQNHMDSVLMLLDQYGIADPAAGNGPGEFSDPFFQSLYEQLVEEGSASPADALKVGATIEELDIVDLEERLAQANNEYILQVYANLLAGSENHLRAFVSNLDRQTGESYQPVYLDQDAYQAIITGTPKRGGGQGGYRGGNGGNNWGGGRGNGRRNGQNNNA